MKREIKTVRIDPEIWHDAKVASVMQRQTLGEFLEMLIKREVRKNAEIQRRKATA